MAIATLFVVLVVSAGFATLRLLGLAKGAHGLSLVAPAGLASLAIVSTWTASGGLPPPAGGAIVLGFALAGLALAVADRHALSLALRELLGEQRLACVLLLTALAIPALALGITLAGVQVPLSPHDGAYHAQVIQEFRHGRLWLDWYPPGMAALFANVLQLLPWLDTAQGALELGEALPMLAALGVFGLGVGVWRNLLAGSLGALFLSLTYVYPYFPQFWSGWPLALSLIMVIGLWTVGLEYLRAPNWQWAVLSGLLLGAILLIHGSELYTTGIVLGVVLVTGWRRLHWARLARHAGLALVFALVVAAPYLPSLLHWAGAGGAYLAGVEDTRVPTSASSAVTGPSLFVVRAIEALGIDLPVRVVLMVAGAVWAIRHRTGRSVVVVGLVFLGITSTFTFLSEVPLVAQAFAATYPWGQQYRIFMVIAIVQSLLAAAGVLALRNALAGRAKAAGPTSGVRRLTRVARVLCATWLLLSIWAITLYISIPAGLVVGYSADDAAAMAWLRTNAAQGAVLANDSWADAGVWAPYKAGVDVVMQRTLLDAGSAQDRALVTANVGRLDQVPEARAAACTLGAGYVYHGAVVSGWDVRRFPSLDDLQASGALLEMYRAGDAVVFQTQLDCGK
jgi:Family of unknown function (DUF6541)